MCSRNNHSLWNSENGFCAFGIGGYCNQTTDECECSPGFVHDLFVLRQRDCSLPKVLMPIIFAFTILFGVLSLLYSINRVKKSVGTAKMIIQLNIVSNLFFLMYAVGYVISGYVFNGAIAVFLTMTVFYFFAASDLLLYSIATPLYIMAEKPNVGFVKAVKFIYILFRLLYFCTLIIMLYSFENSNVRKNDYGWNIAVVAGQLLVIIESSCTASIFFVVGWRLILKIELLIQQTPDNPHHVTTRMYINKVKSLLMKLACVGPTTVSLLLIVFGIYLSQGYLPFSYIPLTFVILANPVGMVAMTTYATREETKAQKDPSPLVSEVFKVNNNNNNDSVLATHIIKSNPKTKYPRPLVDRPRLTSSYIDESIPPNSEYD